MELKRYYQELSAAEKLDLANETGCKPGYLRHVFHGRKRAGPALAIKLEQVTKGAVVKSDLRPDLFVAERSTAA